MGLILILGKMMCFGSLINYFFFLLLEYFILYKNINLYIFNIILYKNKIIY